MARTLAIVLGLMGLITAHARAQPAQDATTREVTRLADEYVAAYTRAFPESAELMGLPLKSHGGLSDNSLAGLARWRALEDDWARRIADIDPAAVSGTPAELTLGFLSEAVQAGRGLRVCKYELWPVNQFGWQVLLLQVLDNQPVGNDRARTEALQRWSKLPRYLDNEVANLREGLRDGYTTPQHNLQLALDQLGGLLAQPLEQSPLYGPAQRDGSAAFQRQWLSLLRKQIMPAIERYRAFVRDDYLAHARVTLAITAHPNGAQCYAASFRSRTTLERSAQETFALGQREVEKNRARALALGRESLGVTDLPALTRRLHDDPANHFDSREAQLSSARAAVERAGSKLAHWFAHVPRAPIVVEPYAAALEAGMTNSYWAASADGKAPATYRIVLRDPAHAMRSRAEITAFHEAYPGHHLQTAYAHEANAAHPISTLMETAGYSEGWARYAESLAEEMGLYTSAYARAQRRLWPARGMVVDPGVHLFGWSRERALAFMEESGDFAGDEAAALFDRIAIWPAQLTAYDTGALEFFALREAAQKALGARFDLRAFHEVVLGKGNLTLPMLRREVERWIEAGRRGGF